MSVFFFGLVWWYERSNVMTMIYVHDFEANFSIVRICMYLICVFFFKFINRFSLCHVNVWQRVSSFEYLIFCFNLLFLSPARQFCIFVICTTHFFPPTSLKIICLIPKILNLVCLFFRHIDSIIQHRWHQVLHVN